MMDLAAFADIERLGALAKANGIDVPSLRGYRLMSKEGPWDDGIIAREENALIGIYWHMGCHGVGPDFDFDCTMEDFIDGYRPAHVPRSRVPKEFRDSLGPTLTVFDEVSMARARWHRQAMLWNRYAGKEGVLYIHSRMGGTGRARGDYYKDGEVFWHEGWDVRDQPWFLDVCADAFDPTYCDIYARIKESERMKLESLTVKPDMHPLGDMGAWVDGYNLTIQLSTESYEEASEVLDMMRECDGKDIEVMLKKRASE